MRLYGVLVLGAVVILGGCAPPPPPPPPPPPLLSLEEIWGSAMDSGLTDEDWIFSFKEPRLPALVKETLLHNRNFWLVLDRIDEVATLARHSGVSLLPVTNLSDGTATSTHDNSNPNSIQSQYHIGLQTAWQSPLWTRLKKEALERLSQPPTTTLSASVLATDISHGRQLLIALVAKSWFVMIGNKLRLDLKREILLTKRMMRDSMQKRARDGIVSPIDINATRLSIARIQESIMRNQDKLDEAALSLKMLLGRYPVFALDEVQALPPVPDPAPAGLPSRLLERRPDIRFKDSQVAVSLNQTANARATQIPQLLLTDSNGNISQSLSDTVHLSAPIWSVITSFLVPNNSNKRSRYLNTTPQRRALEGYANTLYNAFAEVQTVLKNEQLLRVQGDKLMDRIGTLANEMHSKQTGYILNKIDLTILNQAQKEYFETRHHLLNVHVEQLKQRINLYLIIGGHFK